MDEFFVCAGWLEGNPQIGVCHITLRIRGRSSLVSVLTEAIVITECMLRLL